MAVPTASLVYCGVMPLLKTFVALACGYVLAKLGMFPLAASRGASLVSMNIALPALIFADVVPAFTSSTDSALGPVIALAAMYMLGGFIMGVIIREFCYVPRNFWQGIVVMAGMSSWGTLPNAVVMSVTQLPPFNPTIDPILGVSYVSIFTVCFHVVFWIFGAAHSLSWDYLPSVPQGEEANQRVCWWEKPIARSMMRWMPHTLATLTKGVNSPKEAEEAPIEKTTSVAIPDAAITNPLRLPAMPRFPFQSSTTSTPPSQFFTPSTAGTPIHTIPLPNHPSCTAAAALNAELRSHDASQSSIRHNLSSAVPLVSSRLKPVTISIALSLPIGLVRPLKALFVDVSAQGGPNWHGPDGRPPLFLVMDAAQFLTSMLVPLTLIILGASFARIRSVQSPLSRLPIMAMLLVAAAKMVVLPAMGVLVVQAMVHHGLIPEGSKAERFVAVLLSGTPASVNQMVVSSLLAPDDNLETLAAFFLVQYVFMIVGSSALTVISLLLVAR